MSDQPGGFFNAPFAKAILFTSVTTTVACMIVQNEYSAHNNHAELLPLDLELLSSGQWWRLITSHLGFYHPTEFVIGNYVLYTFRRFERQMGSAKFAGFLLVVYGLATSLQFSLMTVFGVNTIAAGPMAILYALLVLYHALVPVVNPPIIKLFGVSISSKTITYIATLYLALHRGPASLIPSLTGLLAGVIYYYELVLPWQSFRLPEFLREIAKTYILPVIGSEPPLTAEQRRRQQIMQQQQEMQRQQIRQMQRMGMTPEAIQQLQQRLTEAQTNGGGGVGGGMPPPASHANPVPPPSEEAIAQLIDLGFNRATVIAALQRANNDVSIAANHLLSS